MPQRTEHGPRYIIMEIELSLVKRGPSIQACRRNGPAACSYGAVYVSSGSLCSSLLATRAVHAPSYRRWHPPLSAPCSFLASLTVLVVQGNTAMYSIRMWNRLPPPQLRAGRHQVHQTGSTTWPAESPPTRSPPTQCHPMHAHLQWNARMNALFLPTNRQQEVKISAVLAAREMPTTHQHLHLHSSPLTSALSLPRSPPVAHTIPVAHRTTSASLPVHHVVQRRVRHPVTPWSRIARTTCPTAQA